MPLGRLLSTGDDLLDFWQLQAHFETIEGATYTEHRRLFSDTSRQIRNQLEIKRWKRERALGRGGFGTVYLEQETEGQLRAVKIVQKTSEKKAVEYLREVLAMANLSRDNGYFIQLYGWYVDELNIYIAMEHVPHRDLQHCVHQALPEDEVRTIILQVVEALEVLHARDWAHRDLKPSNVFVINTGPSWWVKLGDLGVSKRVRDDMTQYQTSIRNNFEAPEMIGIPGVGDDEHYTNAVDIWALGYLMYWLLTLELPFPNNKHLFLYCMQEPTPPLPRHHLAQRSTSDKAIEFLSKLLRPQPETRSTARELLTQTWLCNPTPDESVISDQALQQYRTASSGKVVNQQWSESLRRVSPVRDDMRVQIEPDEREASKEALQQHRTVSSETVIERPRRHSPRQGSPVRDDVHVQTEPDEIEVLYEPLHQYRTMSSGRVIERRRPYSRRRKSPVRDDVHVQTETDEIEASEEGTTTTTTTEKRISQITRNPGSYVDGETAQDAPSKEVWAPVLATYATNLTVTIVAASDLCKGEISRFADPFAVLTIDGVLTQKTSVIKNTINPYWNENFIMRATKDSILTVEVFDQKYFSKNNKKAFLGIIKVRVGDVFNLEIGGDEMLTHGLYKASDPRHTAQGKLRVKLSTPRRTLPPGWERREDEKTTTVKPTMSTITPSRPRGFTHRLH